MELGEVSGLLKVSSIHPLVDGVACCSGLIKEKEQSSSPDVVSEWCVSEQGAEERRESGLSESEMVDIGMACVDVCIFLCRYLQHLLLFFFFCFPFSFHYHTLWSVQVW